MKINQLGSRKQFPGYGIKFISRGISSGNPGPICSYLSTTVFFLRYDHTAKHSENLLQTLVLLWFLEKS